MAPNPTDDEIKPDARIVLILGAGVHRAAKLKSPRGQVSLQNLASWSGIQNGFYYGYQLGQTLAWELNALANQATDEQSAQRLKEEQLALAQRLDRDSKRLLRFDWQPPEALHELLMSGAVTDVISLNVDLVLEQWLANALKIKRPTVHRRNGEERSNKGNQNSDRAREFKKLGTEEGIRFWYPHGDVSKPSSLQFGLSDYAKALNWMSLARSKYKAREKNKGKLEKYLTWLDPLLSKRQVLILGASLDPAEWDVWYALLCRWRNFAQFEDEDWYPVTRILSIKGGHIHLPQGYIERIEGCTYDESWALLQAMIHQREFNGRK